MHRLNTPPDLLNMIIYYTSRYYQVETITQPKTFIWVSEAMYISIESKKKLTGTIFLEDK